MKRIWTLALALAMVLSLVACGGGAAKTDAELEAEGWVKNPLENGYIKLQEPDVLSGSSIKPTEDGQLKPEEIKALAMEYLRGWEFEKDANGNPVWSYREMYQIATAYGGNPGISSVEYVLDPDNMTLYTANEKGTQKLIHMEENPYVELYWVHQIHEEDFVPGKNDYWVSYGVKFAGRYIPLKFDKDDPEFLHCAELAFKTNMGATTWNSLTDEQKLAMYEQQAAGLDFYKIEIDEMMVVSLGWMWNKPGREDHARGLYDPTSPYFGKDVYQFYTVER
ncbi:pyridoxamine 5'-phosphate oxidase family protein [Eubacteriales bacterium OttesenSCG-928-N14]|nr:pyridoxamine 5'-phosphate oxidase family protein [Eubacteriales bacterium OttesenSCG-928-N14]